MPTADFAYLLPPFAAMAHRGGLSLAANIGRENTIHAFRNAEALGFGYLETDVRATRDGRLVAFHDETLDRVSDATGPVSARTLTELRRVRVGGEPIAGLDEVLEEFPDMRFNIDAKDDRSVAPLAHAIERHAAWSRVCVASFRLARLRRFRALASRPVCTAAAPAQVLSAAVLGRLGSATLSAPPVVQAPLDVVIAGRRVRFVRRALVARCHRMGKRLHVWTVNDPAEMADLLDLGVDGIVTDRPDLLKRTLLERGAWPE